MRAACRHRDRLRRGRSRLRQATTLALLVCLLPDPASAAPTRAQGFVRTERRERCRRADRNRLPFFGDLHVHTSFSWDSNIFGNTRNDPAAAYAFARGEARPILLDGTPQLTRLRRPLDFAAVTDHAEYFGETRICVSPGVPGYDSIHCRTFRGEASPPSPYGAFTAFELWGLNLTFPATGDISTCDAPNADCDANLASVWQDTQAAAEAAYDQTGECKFTSFVAYEYTGSTRGFNGHRNVIFRNANVPATPTSSFETDGTNPPALWRALQRTCRKRQGCQVLTIPHNANLSGGMMFTAPESVEEASTRALFEPLVELTQIKGGSECRFDRLLGRGAGTTDEECAWEQKRQQMQSDVPPAEFMVGIDDYPRSSMIRNVLKGGLLLDRQIGVNPFKLGFIGSTDTHNGTPGAVDEDRLHGSHGGEDDTLQERVQGLSIYDNPGGLAVVWAEENSRDALFEAMKRRETFATSGTRPVVRFFGGWSLPDDLCERSNQVRRAYAKGVAMGSDLPRTRRRSSPPRFYVSAMKDPGTDDYPGTDLQRIQIVKGWIEADGTPREHVFDVAGSVTGAFVNPATCAPSGRGFADLCRVWADPTWDPSQHAFYYARVLENPSCRWSTFVCKQLGVDPFAPNCVGTAPEGLENCCLDRRSDEFVEPVTQERAWTSPIWYRPRRAR